MTQDSRPPDMAQSSFRPTRLSFPETPGCPAFLPPSAGRGFLLSWLATVADGIIEGQGPQPWCRRNRRVPELRQHMEPPPNLSVILQGRGPTVILANGECRTCSGLTAAKGRPGVSPFSFLRHEGMVEIVVRIEIVSVQALLVVVVAHLGDRIPTVDQVDLGGLDVGLL